MTATIKKLGATLAVLATVCFNPIPASAQETDLTTQLDAFDPATADPVTPTTSLDELRHPSERDIYDVDTSDWDFSEPGMNKNNIDNHYYEQLLPTDLGEPQPQIINGQMRSDRITLPGTVTKHEADQAEVMEAKEQQPQLRAMTADNCRTYWPRPHQVCGAIKAKYESLAVAWAGQTPLSFLGLPKSGELTNPDGVGKRTEFDNGFIYWHPDTGAWSVTTHNSIVWARNGWEQGRLGYPTSDEIGTGDNVGRKQSFQRGRIYGSLSGVVSIEGKILEKWIETGEEKGPLGYPATDEEGTPDGVGRFNRFALGMIYWHPRYGAHPITGVILLQWIYSGGVTGGVGYPLSDPKSEADGWFTQEFEHTTIDGQNIADSFPNWNPFATSYTNSLADGGMMRPQSALNPPAAGGNAYTDQIVLKTTDRCDTPVTLRRGWYNNVDKGPWGYDKIFHKHGIWNLRSIRAFIELNCMKEMQGTDAVYEGLVEQRECDGLGKCWKTGESVKLRMVNETFAFLENATHPRGVNTLYPIHGTGTHGNSDIAPSWINYENLDSK
ncbi:LGFP repeat-containing protein [Corynebacterium hindlerae]|uniref:LGFP repeat-containing protein n=1 Tax=Corynebacterium hindlerae TaxID=699041 RepID=UPI001AD6B5A7|nr:LGFP repeat-containing protein [Corynebacterium hindlerae]QTH60150.1 LGFP repeat-containing protein [Corynebacterium hindlerae]